MLNNSIGNDTQLVGILKGLHVHSKSPDIQNAAFDHLDLDWAYLPLPVHIDQIEKALKGAVALGFRGLNVTAPHKETVLPFMNQLSASATAIHAVNTISIGHDGKLSGDNTDAAGFIADLKDQNIDVSQKSALVLGAGGSSRAIIYGLLKSGCPKIILANRTLDKAKQVAAQISASFGQSQIITTTLNEENLKTHAKADLIINCTSMGMEVSEPTMPWFESLKFNKKQTVYDLVYHPNPTVFLQKAKADGAKAINGLGMLAHQGALAFTIWTGHMAPVEIMKKALKV